MNKPAITKATIISELSRIPDDNLEKVKTYIESLLIENRTSPPKNQSLKGIWKNAGFEKISNIEDELRIVRKELKQSIIKKTI